MCSMGRMRSTRLVRSSTMCGLVGCRRSFSIWKGPRLEGRVGRKGWSCGSSRTSSEYNRSNREKRTGIV